MYGLKRNVPLKNLTTMRVGGNAAYYAETSTVGELRTALKIPGPHFVIGKGSNLLVSDAGYNGTVIRLKADSVALEDGLVYAEAGAGLPWLTRVYLTEGLSGMEWAAGIPSTLGGALKMNAGAFGSCMADVTHSVNVLRDGFIITLKGSECGFGYRTSGFEEGDVILGAALCSVPGDRAALAALLNKYTDFRRRTQPKGFSAGSVFKAAGDKAAGWYIERAGLKGVSVGGARVSEKHANFIINSGFASAADVRSLIDVIKAEVFVKFNVKLCEEIKYLGDF